MRKFNSDWIYVTREDRSKFKLKHCLYNEVIFQTLLPYFYSEHIISKWGRYINIGKLNKGYVFKKKLKEKIPCECKVRHEIWLWVQP